MAVQEKFADEMLSDDELDAVAGGSWAYRQKDCENAGIYLLKEDGTPGSWGNLWNIGDYYFQGHKLNDIEVQNAIDYYKKHKKQAPCYATIYYNDKQKLHNTTLR